MRRSRSGIVALLALAMVVVPAVPAAAQTCGTCVASSVVEDVTGTNEDHVIPASFPTLEEAEKCTFQGSCPHLEDVAFVDVDISDQMASYENGADFVVSNEKWVSVTTLWWVCSYDSSGDAIKCYWPDGRGDGRFGELTKDARELRLMPIQSPVTEYRLDIDTW